MNQDFINMVGSLRDAGNLIQVLEDTQPEVSVRLNPRKPGYKPENTDGEVPWFKGGLYLSDRPRFTLVPELHSGAFYVQDASSMFTARVLEQVVASLGNRPVVYLDACAAPGGKTTAAVDVLPDGSLVVANEFDPKRCGALLENMMRWGYPATVITRGDAVRLGKCRGMFDVIAADLPCSGEGMMRKEPEAVSQWSKGLVKECAQTQYRIIEGLVPALKPGGYLIYSTCTFNTAENELNVARIIREFGLEPVDIEDVGYASGISAGEDADPGVPSGSCVRFYPGKVRGEGQFVALLRKSGQWKPEEPKCRGKRKPFAGENLIDSPESYTAVSDEEIFPLCWTQQLKAIGEAANIVRKGLPLGVMKGKDFIPSHNLALSTILRKGAYPEVELDKDQALDYLRGNAPRLPEDTPRGIVLLTHSGFPLGFAKNIGNRANSLLPSAHRIHTL